MKIFLIAPFSKPVPPISVGGSEHLVADLAEGLAHEGHEVLLAASHDSKVQHSNIRIVGSCERAIGDGDDSPRYVEFTREALRIAKEERVDIVHNHAGERVLDLPEREGIEKNRFLMTMHFPPRSCIGAWSRYDGSWNSISFAQARKFNDVGGQNVGTVHNAVHVSTFPFGDRSNANSPLVFLGRMSPDKGVHVAISVAQNLGKKLIIAGRPSPGEDREYNYFKQKIVPLFGGNIEYIGEVDAVKKRSLLKEAHALLMPILWDEPFGLVSIEALSCGTPVVAFARGAMPEIIQNGKTGFLVQSEEEMISAVEKIDSIVPFNCRKDAEERFDVSVMTRNYVDLYRDILST